MTADQIRDMIAAKLACQHIELSGDGQHWYVTIVSSEFDGERRIRRHQRVYATLGGTMDSGELHALSIKAFTPSEWAAK